MKSRSRTRVSGIFELQPLEIRRFFTTAALSGGVLTITGTTSAETITVNKDSSGRISVTGVSTLFTGSSVTSIVINAQAGNDTITITGAVGASIPSTINAGDGNDQIATGLGDDVIFGQNGFDTVNYTARTNRITVRIDGLANDGETQNGEADNINAEEVLGGSGNDLFYGNDSANFFAGGGGADEMAAAGGADELVGGTGSDKLYGEGGDDALYAKNSDTDTVNGGSGPLATDLDLAETDAADVATSISSAAAARLAALSAAVNPAALDPTYGGAGSGLNSGPAVGWDLVAAATVDSLGRTILVGYFDGPGAGGDFAAVRYNADGTFDSTFAGDGQAEIDFKPGNASSDDHPFGVTTDAANNIIIVGESEGNFAVCRLTSAGALDAGFGARVYDLGAADGAADVVVDDLGNIVVAGTTTPSNGNSDIAVVRITPGGALDTTFNGTGKRVLAAPGAQVASAVIMDELLQGVDEGILVGGNVNGDFVLARFTLDGAVDATFGSSAGYSVFTFGASTTDQLKDLMVNPVTGQVVAVGQSNGAGAILAVDANGSSNAQFQTYGLTGKVVSFNAVAYDSWNAGFALVGTAGTLDSKGAFVSGDFVVAKFDTPATFADGFTGLLTTDLSPAGTSWSDVALGLGVVRGKLIVGGYSQTTAQRAVQTSVARYDVAVGAKAVEDGLSFEDVQNNPGANRSELATYYLKSTHVDDQGRATINLTDNNDIVIIDKVIAGDGRAQARVNVNGLYLAYDMDMTSLTINCFNGSDVVTFAPGTNPNDITLPLFIFGGNGTDNLTGGGGGDVIVGGLGNDTIVGNNGNDILVGGQASDDLNGGNGEDILVGTTAFDEDLGALTALRAEWTSNTPRQDRINHIRGTTPGGLNGTIFLTVGTGGTISDDSAKDTYTGGNDLDWFFRRITGGSGSRDLVLDNLLGEETSDF